MTVRIVGVLLAPKPATSTACDKIDERFDWKDARIHELDRKLSALIAALNMAEQIQVALDGQLLDPGRATGAPPQPPPMPSS